MAEKQSQASEISAAIKQICEEKNIPYESVIETIESALAVAYRKEYGQKGQDIRVEFNPTDASTKIFDVKTVVPDELFEEYEKEREEREKAEAEGKELPEKEEPKKKEEEKKDKKPEPLASAKRSGEAGSGEGNKADEGEDEEEKARRYNPKTDIPLSEAQKEYPDIEVEDEIKTELDQPEGYGRMAAQTAKQVIIQKLREAERDTLYNAYKDKAGEVINAVVQRVEGRMAFVDLGQAVAVLPPGEQIHGENYTPGQRLKVLLLSVERTSKGPEIIASRAHPDLVRELFRAEVPEINDGTIEIKAVAREAGSRTKLAVQATEESIDPIGSCVGQKGTRVQTIISELNGEKIDIIEWSDDQVKFIINSLSPAKVINVELQEAGSEEEENKAIARVADDQFSLAIGKNGQNVRLASKLSGWKIDVVKEEGDSPSPEDSEESDDNKDKKDKEGKKDKKEDDEKPEPLASAKRSGETGSGESEEDEAKGEKSEGKEEDEKKEKDEEKKKDD